MIPHYHFDCVDSTNAYAKQFTHSLDPNTPFKGAIFTATTQTNGKGRLSHSWYSPPNEGLYYTALIPGKVDYKNISNLTKKYAKISIKCISKITGITPQLEWPNDIIIQNKKLGGILIETIGRANHPAPTHIIIGIGLNLNHLTFPPPLNITAISLRQITQTLYNRQDFTHELTKEIYKCLFGAYEGLSAQKPIPKPTS